MNPIGIHFGYWTQYWEVEPLPFVQKAKQCGFDVLEVRAQKIGRMSRAERDTLKKAAADAGPIHNQAARSTWLSRAITTGF
jgi:hypothetical protein